MYGGAGTPADPRAVPARIAALDGRVLEPRSQIRYGCSGETLHGFQPDGWFSPPSILTFDPEKNSQYNLACAEHRYGFLARKEPELAIYRTLYYSDVTVGVGGRITIPQDMRDDCGLNEGDTLTVRVEENPKGIRQMVIWRADPQPGEE